MLDLIKDKLFGWYEWGIQRYSERTSWDGTVIIAVCLSVLVLGKLVWWAAWLGLAYGIWTLVKEEA